MPMPDIFGCSEDCLVCNCRGRRSFLAVCSAAALGVHEQSNDKTIKTQDFGENKDQDHADKQPGLLGSTTNTSITDNSDSETSSHTSKTDSETGTELNEVLEERRVLLKIVGDQDGDDETVNTDDTSHDDGDNILDNQVGAEDTHGRDTDTCLGSSVGGAETCKDDG